MERARKPFINIAANAALCSLILSGCGGGGSAKVPSSPPTPTPSSAPAPTPIPQNIGLSAFSIQSVPGALSFTSSFGAAGKTPATLVPNDSTSVAKITIQPSNGAAPFIFAADQLNVGGQQTVFYNQQADTNGSIKTDSSQSYGRAAQTHFTKRLYRSSPRGDLTDQRQVVVSYHDTVLTNGASSPQSIEQQSGATTGTPIGPDYNGLIRRIVTVPPQTTVSAFADQLRTHPEIASVSVVHLRHALSSIPITPNDPYDSPIDQWDLTRISAPNAWGYTTGTPTVAVAIIDTGADTTETDLAGPKFTYGESDLNGVNTVGIAAAKDTDGHGTNVSGIAAAATNNGLGFASIGYNVSLQIYKIFPDGPDTSATTADEAQAIYHAVTHGARVINLSLGATQDTGFDQTESDAIAYAIAHNVTVVAAAGNDRSNGVTTIDYPAAYPGVIAVGASALDDSQSGKTTPSTAREYVAAYSNSGPGLSLVAPGGDPTNSSDEDPLHWISGLYSQFTTDGACTGQPVNNCAIYIAGTSQAAPHVAGTAALMLSKNPNLTPAQILAILESTADNINDPNQGSGRLNAYRALAAVSGDHDGIAPATTSNYVAFAYNGSISGHPNMPNILDVSYPHGVAVSATGTFRIADIPSTAARYRIAVWADTNGNDVVDTGDYFAVTATNCTATATCAGTTGLQPQMVGSGFVLP